MNNNGVYIDWRSKKKKAQEEKRKGKINGEHQINVDGLTLCALFDLPLGVSLNAAGADFCDDAGGKLVAAFGFDENGGLIAFVSEMDALGVSLIRGTLGDGDYAMVPSATGRDFTGNANLMRAVRRALGLANGETSPLGEIRIVFGADNPRLVKNALGKVVVRPALTVISATISANPSAICSMSWKGDFVKDSPAARTDLRCVDELGDIVWELPSDERMALLRSAVSAAARAALSEQAQYSMPADVAVLHAPDATDDGAMPADADDSDEPYEDFIKVFNVWLSEMCAEGDLGIGEVGLKSSVAVSAAISPEAVSPESVPEGDVAA